MVTFRAVPATDPSAVAVLTDYFAMRAAAFPGEYRPAFPGQDAFREPGGVFLLALDDHGAVLGCGAVRRLADGDSGPRFEIKHLFVQPAERGAGTGRAILEELERRAASWGATELVLDTHHTLEAAGGLYARSGYEQIEPYNENPNATRWYGKAVS
ncbi:GNAT family N-acetyltransferase [Microbacterium sp. NPDC057659]|uniref:GNAT family N-acetyltransferase n=1 Tax=Microbacterium sp. NPDC057659 TaxID=3346198 RepID=UPI00366E71D6